MSSDFTESQWASQSNITQAQQYDNEYFGLPVLTPSGFQEPPHSDENLSGSVDHEMLYQADQRYHFPTPNDLNLLANWTDDEHFHTPSDISDLAIPVNNHSAQPSLAITTNPSGSPSQFFTPMTDFSSGSVASTPSSIGTEYDQEISGSESRTLSARSVGNSSDLLPLRSEGPTTSKVVSGNLETQLLPSTTPFDGTLSVMPQEGSQYHTIRRYRCSHPGCDRRFANQYTLQVHTTAHSPKPPVAFPCTMGCSEHFSRRHDRLRHEVAKHGRVCEFTCEDCGHFFSSQRTMGNHKCAKAQGMTRWVK